MNIQRPRFKLNNLMILGAIARRTSLKVIAPISLILVGAAPLSAQVIRTEIYRTPLNNSIIYTNPFPSPVNSSIIYGSPIPAPVIIRPSINYFSYPSYYPQVTRIRNTTRNSPVLINPIIDNSTLINPTIIEIQPQGRYRPVERYRRF